MLSVSIETNASLLAAALGDIRGEQIPYATARALTDVAFKVQHIEKSEMAQMLTLRNRFSVSGVQVNPAEKSDWPEISAQVGIEKRRSYLIDHVLGGKREGGTHGRAILAQESLRTSSGRVTKAKRPSALIAKARRAQSRRGKRAGDQPFLLRSSWGEILARRSQDEPLQILYAFKKGVSIKREFEMDRIAQREVGASYHQAFNKALRKAIKS